MGNCSDKTLEATKDYGGPGFCADYKPCIFRGGPIK